jgi:O-antigen ligase
MLFISVSWSTYDPINIISSSVLILLSLLILINQKKIDLNKNLITYIPFSIATLYFLVGLINHQNFHTIIAGGYQRNFGVVTFFALAILFFIGTNLEVDLCKFRNSLFVTLIFANIYGYLQLINKDPLPWSGSHDGITLTLGNPNFAGAFLGLLGCIPIAKFMESKSYSIKFFSITVYISTIYLGFQTKALQFQILIFLGTLIVVNALSLSSTVRKWRLIRGLSIASFICSVIAIALIFSTNLFPYFRSFISSETSIPQRLDYWQTGFKIFRQNILTGVGPDEYHRYAAIFRNSEQVKRDGYMAIPDRAHNIFIDHFANGGIFIGLLWIIFVFYVSSYALKIMVSSSSIDRFYIAPLISLWFLYILQSLISPDQIILASIGFLSGGLIVRIHLRLKNLSNIKDYNNIVPNLSGKILLIPLLIFAIIFTSKSIWYDTQAKKIINGEINNQLEIKEIIKSRFATAKTLEIIAIKNIEDNSTCEFINLVSNEILKRDNRSAQAWFFKAICMNRVGDTELALNYVQQSLEFDPLNVTYLLGKAELEIKLQRILDAKDTIDKIYSINPIDKDVIELNSFLENELSS